MKYRKKPVEVDAEIYREGMEDGWYVLETDVRCGGVYYLHNSAIKTDIHQKLHPAIKTLEGWLKISEGDYIITGIKGERYPCKPDIFNESYEVAE